MKWLGNAPRMPKGITWGHPWSQGTLEKSQMKNFQKIGDSPVQTKIMAYWPDGSIKWTGHTAILSKDNELNFDKSIIKPVDDIGINKYNGIYIDNGLLTAYFPKKGEGINLIDWIKIHGEDKISDVKAFIQINSIKKNAKIEKIELEENGPVKSIVKVTSFIKDKGKILYEFITRFKFYRDLNSIDITHTFIVGDDTSIEGIALSYHSKIEGEPWNRHIRFGGESSIYTEPAQLLMSRRYCVDNIKYDQQVQGKIVEMGMEDQTMLLHAKENAIWNNFRFSQLSSSHYELDKQTDAAHTFLKIGSGKRANGMIYSGGIHGGTAFILSNFWEKYPASLTVTDLNEKLTETTAWLWTPQGGNIDFRHYSKRDHMLSAYEGMEEIRSTPIGIGNSSQLALTVYSENPTNEELWDVTLDVVNPPLIISEPEIYHDSKVFGIWSLPDFSNPMKAFLESQMEYLFNFYRKEVDQRDWYGFWNYGDVMHTYDPYRHTWRYDLGGYAWQNTELVPNMWLWQYFLRTGKEDVFRMAEAMTRHTSEVDMYHCGEYQGLGSRHNVLHWGCQCKEVRMSMAGLHRYYYYLTGDERIGDILEEVKDNHQYAFENLEPLREFYKSNEKTNPIRVGPDWAALVSNWFTEYERTGNIEYLNNITTGIDSIKTTPMRLLSGPTYHFDPDTKKLHYFGTGNVGGYHMIISFGAPQVWLELADNIENPEWNEMLAEFGRFYALPEEDKIIQSNGALTERDFAWPMFASGMMAYAANYYNDKELAKKVWNILLTTQLSGIPLPVEETVKKAFTWKNIEEMPWISTNVVSQWCLNIMICLELIGEDLPELQNKKNRNEETNK